MSTGVWKHDWNSTETERHFRFWFIGNTNTSEIMNFWLKNDGTSDRMIMDVILRIRYLLKNINELVNAKENLDFIAIFK